MTSIGIITLLAHPAAQEVSSNFEIIETLSGKIYKDCKIKRLDPDGLYILHSRGIGKIFFSELSQEWQTKFGFDPSLATKFQAAQNAANSEISRQNNARNELIRDRITGHFKFSSPNTIRTELVSILQADAFARADGRQILTREISEIVRTKNGLGGEGLPIRTTTKINEEKALEPVLVISSKATLDTIYQKNELELTLYPIPLSDEIFDFGEKVYAVTAEEALSKSNQIARLLSLRMTPFTSLKFLRQTIEEIEANADPLTLQRHAIENGKIVNIETAQSPEKLAIGFSVKKPVPADVIVISKNAICETVAIISSEKSLPIRSNDLIAFLANIEGTPFEEISIQNPKEEPASESATPNTQNDGDQNWIDKFGTIKAFWSTDGGIIALAKASQLSTQSYSDIWVSTAHQNPLRKIKASSPPSMWWDEIRRVLDGEPPRIYQTTEDLPNTIDSFLNGAKTPANEKKRN